MTAPSADNSEDFQVLHPDPIRRVELAMADLREGRMVILVDDEDRENEGDLVVAAEKCTPDAINFMARHGRGLICLALTPEQVERLGLQMMVTNNQSPYNTAFTVSIEAREGVTTGISAADRAHTVKVAIDPRATRRDIVTPGHMFPLRARHGGVLERVGQTEGSVDLARLAGLSPAGVICEVMKDDGTMARMPDLKRFGNEHHIRIVAIADLIKYRMRTERIVRCESEGTLDTEGLGRWNVRLYRGLVHGDLHMAMFLGDPSGEVTLTRVQAAPPSWAVFAPGTAKLAQQAEAARRAIYESGGGVLVLMHLNGGSAENLKQVFVKDFEGEAKRRPVQRAAALRDLGTGCQILVDLGLRGLRLLSSSKRPIVGVEAYGLSIVERVRLETGGSDS
jgi:3,4-dihydroxy 2-butanone 4-phosphate synthase/GTP cyclohydrolase II